MSKPPEPGQAALEQLIIQNIPRDAFMALEDAYFSGDLRCIRYAMLFDKGHRASGAGHNRHFFNNETFREALETHGASPSPLCGSKVVTGRIGKFNIARLNVPGHKWVNLKTSKSRRLLAEANTAIERVHGQGDLFDDKRPITEGTIFVLGVMDGLDADTGVAKLTQVMIALPAPNMKSWLYCQPIKKILALYEQSANMAQPDNAVPKLKAQPKKQTGNDQGN